jgi:hypothetical protein
MNMGDTERSRLAVLATVGDLHLRMANYDLARLRAIVAASNPDLLCLEMTKKDWESKHFQSVPIEVSGALIPLAEVSDVVVVPVLTARASLENYAPVSGVRLGILDRLDRLFRWGQKTAARPEVIHSAPFEAFCHVLYGLTERAWAPTDRARWDLENKGIVSNTVAALERDQGRRALLVVRCQRMHRITPLLRRHSANLDFVDYREI